MEKLYPGRATVVDNDDYLEITIPAKRIWLFMGFFGLWISAWFLGGVSVIVSIFLNSNSEIGFVFIPIWLIITSVIILLIGRIVWWMAFGKEVIFIERNTLSIEKKGAWFLKLKSYDLKQAVNFRVQEDYISYNNMWNRLQLSSLFMNTGTIRFDYGMKTIKFAGNIDEAEASYLLNLLYDKQLLTKPATHAG